MRRKRALRAGLIAGFLVQTACSGSTTPAQIPPAFVPPSPPSGVTSISPTSVDLPTLGSVAIVTASETGYGGAFRASTDCASTTVSPATATPSLAGGPVSFTVRAGTASETCSLTIADATGTRGKIPIAVSVRGVGSLGVAPATLAVTTATDATFTASEPGYGGSLDQFFRATTSCTPANAVAVASSAFPATPGAAATFTVTANAPGTCTATISDILGRQATVAITSTRAIAFTSPSLFFADLTPQTVGAREHGVSAFTFQSSTCGTLAAVNPVASDPTSFTIAATATGLTTGGECMATFSDGNGGTGSVHVYVDFLSIGVQ